MIGSAKDGSNMNTTDRLLLGLALFDLILLTSFYLVRRRSTPLTKTGLISIGAGLLGFAAHALIFFSGGFLVIQLATIAGLFAICLFSSRKTGVAPR
jgi:hypothetical protein